MARPRTQRVYCLSTRLKITVTEFQWQSPSVGLVCAVFFPKCIKILVSGDETVPLKLFHSYGTSLSAIFDFTVQVSHQLYVESSTYAGSKGEMYDNIKDIDIKVIYYEQSFEETVASTYPVLKALQNIQFDQSGRFINR